MIKPNDNYIKNIKLQEEPDCEETKQNLEEQN